MNQGPPDNCVSNLTLQSDALPLSYGRIVIDIKKEEFLYFNKNKKKKKIILLLKNKLKRIRINRNIVLKIVECFQLMN